ncbi:hypothetical protein MSAN_01527500 [Mycena sanguinolenta]|uniref:Uncharacterized protein n=1 Tax=Mycena sanguinolenta TaxID=230812 RepID=A0A8H6Y684_9AGAR|nr:hypothetical protein MSAN_01527500 [Mycena sanguinolenta]
MSSSSLSSEAPAPSTLNPCAATCFFAAGNACPDCDPCFDANFMAMMSSIWMNFIALVKPHPRPEKVTATTPFLPSNSNADILIQPSTGISSSGGTATATSSHASPQTPLKTVHRYSPWTAAIATSVVTDIVALTLAILLVRMRKRKLRTRERRTLDQLPDS